MLKVTTLLSAGRELEVFRVRVFRVEEQQHTLWAPRSAISEETLRGLPQCVRRQRPMDACAHNGRRGTRYERRWAARQCHVGVCLLLRRLLEGLLACGSPAILNTVLKAKRPGRAGPVPEDQGCSAWLQHEERVSSKSRATRMEGVSQRHSTDSVGVTASHQCILCTLYSSHCGGEQYPCGLGPRASMHSVVIRQIFA
jgi:hypothetical protein